MNNTDSTLTVLTNELAPPPTSALEIMQRSEIDIQISTAHRYPRSMVQFLSRAKAMALIDEETAASCIYSRPVGGGKFAEGLSVRAAEIVAASYGNIRIGATIIEQTERYVKARGFAHDLESNTAAATEVIESTVKRDGTPYDERMRIVIAKSALAKARRDATFQVVPKALFRSIELECRKVALGEGQTITQRRGRISQWITKLGIDAKRVWAVVGVQGEADLTDEHFITLTGLKTAIAEGEVTIDEAFPVIIPSAKVGEAGAAKKANPLGKPRVTNSPPKADLAPGAEEGGDQTPKTPTDTIDADKKSLQAIIKKRIAAVEGFETTPNAIAEFMLSTGFSKSGKFADLTLEELNKLNTDWEDTISAIREQQAAN